ncbi:MAG TPA: DinB family protein [Streptosporangiaceae bacterium]|nr:DinB family protein [Streptosporangiaceae bacterium]
MTTQAAFTEEELVGTAGERELLEGFLEYHRHVVSGKLRGLSEADARRQLVPSLTTPIGLVKHAAAVERAWFQHYLAGRPREQVTGNARGDNASWEVGADETIADVVAEYEDACAESRRIAAGVDLGHTVPHDRLGPVSLRWIYVHMIREHARHIGHADVIREQIDGATGD